MNKEETAIHEKYMHRCLQLALLGKAHVAPNPMVGAVLVYQNRIIGEGYHQQFGLAHAEVNCIHHVAAHDKHLIPESTLYVSLEPCSHKGKTPPCTNLILSEKIKRVVIGSTDFSTKVNGSGIRILREHGVEVIEHVLNDACVQLNKRFFTSQIKKRPYIVLKWAQSEDGYIGRSDARVPISNSQTNLIVHQWRAHEMAILVGYRTALIDNPSLTVRNIVGPQPLRIIIDRQGDLPDHLQLMNDGLPTLIYTLHSQRQYPSHITPVYIPFKQVASEIVDDLYVRNIQSVLIEGGRATLQSFIDLSLWDKIIRIQSSLCLHQGIPAPEVNHITFSAPWQVDTDSIQIAHKPLF